MAFPSAWAGLEIFVSQNFSEYEAAAFERLSGPDKFSLIAFELTTPADPAEDEAIFRELKEGQTNARRRGRLLVSADGKSTKTAAEVLETSC